MMTQPTNLGAITERRILIDKGNDARKWIAHAETAIQYGRIQHAEDCAAAAQALLSEIIAACEVMRNGLTKP